MLKLFDEWSLPVRLVFAVFAVGESKKKKKMEEKMNIRFLLANKNLKAVPYVSFLPISVQLFPPFP